MCKNDLPALVVMACIFAVAALEVDPIHIDPATGHYMDSHGRTRIFHGMNVVYKKAPWYPPSKTFNPADSLDAETMDLMQHWGFNVVRLGVMWPGVEPSRGKIDQGYLKEVVRLSEQLAKRGIYTVADLHQDVGSRRFCGEGFPEHYIDALFANKSSSLAKADTFPKPIASPSNVPLNASGFPTIEDCAKNEFAKYYETYAVGAMWNELYTPGTDMNNGFLRYWAAVAGALAHAPQLLAYELLNEPSGFCLGGTLGSCVQSATVIASNAVEMQQLTPLYQAAAKVIRSASAKQPILYEATVPPKLTAQIFSELPLGEDSQQGLAYHIYCAPGDGNGLAGDLACKVFLNLYYDTYFTFLKKNPRIASFMTEFGAVGGNQGELTHLNMLLGEADNNLQSWAYWMLKKYNDFTTANSAESLYDENGQLEVAKLKVLSRTYSQAIAGTPKHMTFDPDTADFLLEFNATVTTAPTVIYLNEDLYYPNGFAVNVQPANCFMQQKSSRNHIELLLLETASCQGTQAVVKVTANSLQNTMRLV